MDCSVLKKFVPDFGAFAKTNWAKPAIGKGNIRNTVLAILALVMVVAVFLPWFHWEYLLSGDKETTLEAYNKLGIASLWGILGFVFTLVALYGVLYKQYAYTFWAAIIAAIFGCIGSGMITGFEFSEGKTDYIVYKEALKQMKMTDTLIPATHVGANIFKIAAVALAALSLVELFKKDEEAEQGCIAKVALTVTAIIAFVLCFDAALVNPTFLSVLAAKILAWNLPLVAILLIAAAYFKGEGKSYNTISIVLLVVAFFFTNPVTIDTKYNLVNSNEVQNIREHFQRAQDDSLVTCTDSYKDLSKELEKLQEKETKKTEQDINNHSVTDNSGSGSGRGGRVSRGSSRDFEMDDEF